MGDLMLLGVLRAPTPEPDNILGIVQLADRARQAADEIERLTAELSLYRTGKAYSLAADEIERLQARVEALEGALAGAVRELEDLSCSGPGGDNEGCYDWSKYTDLAATEQEGEI